MRYWYLKASNMNIRDKHINWSLLYDLIEYIGWGHRHLCEWNKYLIYIVTYLLYIMVNTCITIFMYRKSTLSFISFLHKMLYASFQCTDTIYRYITLFISLYCYLRYIVNVWIACQLIFEYYLQLLTMVCIIHYVIWILSTSDEY